MSNDEKNKKFTNKMINTSGGIFSAFLLYVIAGGISDIFSNEKIKFAMHLLAIMLAIFFYGRSLWWIRKDKKGY